MKLRYLLLLLPPLCGTPPAVAARPDSTGTRPDHVNNALSPCFPPVFSQDGGSCGSASRIGYMFTHEINAYRHAAASATEHIYPTHFTWLLTNSHSGKEGMAKANGVPNAVVYGGTTYSRRFGNQDCADPDFGWMQGYDKWYEAMFNRIERNSFCPDGLDTEQGRERVKNWLWNHCGDTDFAVGGVAGIGVASACKQGDIPDDPLGVNRAAGVVGMKLVPRGGDGVDHALTIVGYDDRILFDLDGNGIAGEADKDERGAWIIVNSWGSGWANGGFIYCPYKYSFPVRTNESGAWRPEFYHVRKDYRPLRTLKVLMDYSRRSELKLRAGIAADTCAATPDATIDMEHFKFAGDGRPERQKMGLEARTPMLGRWADGRLHTEPMEFGYDLTDLSAGFDTRRPLKYFFIIERKDDAIGTGMLRACSVTDYEFDSCGVETPAAIGRGLRIERQGARTVVSVVVQGEPLFAPADLRPAAAGLLEWNKPQATHFPLRGYVVYEKDRQGETADTLAADRTTCRPRHPQAALSIAALYGRGDTLALSTRTVAAPRPAVPARNAVLRLENGGFSIPRAFGEAHREATVEYWLRPDTLSDWNQSAGRDWGQFLIHASASGALTAGWDTRSRVSTAPGTLKAGTWSHIAVSVAGDTMTVYVDGREAGRAAGSGRNGLAAFGDFRFRNIDGDLAEVRLWKTARTADEIRRTMHERFTGIGLPEELLAYCHATRTTGDSLVWADAVSGRTLSPPRREGGKMTIVENVSEPALADAADATLDIVLPAGTVRAGEQFEVKAATGTGITSLEWALPATGETRRDLRRAHFILNKAGSYDIALTGTAANGRTVRTTKRLTVQPRTFDAAFRPSRPVVSAGERITFLPVSPLPGGSYEWSLPKADRTTAFTTNAAATYERAGNYRVRLRVTDPATGRTRRAALRFRVEEVAPEAAFDISPRVVLRGESVTLTDRSRFVPTAWHWRVESRRKALYATGRKAEVKTAAPGVYDVTLTAANGKGTGTHTEHGALIVCNADSRNGLNFGNAAAAATAILGRTAAARRLTLEWWMNANPQKATAGIGGDSLSWHVAATPAGSLALFVGGKRAARTDEGFIVPGQWHHYAVRFDGGEVVFFRDGEALCTRHARRTGALPPSQTFTLGGTGRPMNAAIDEVRLWGRALADTTLQRYANAPVPNVSAAEKADSLLLYYDFNQNGGDVQDRTSHARHARRTGFGPDGDAWGLSAGVFSLDIETPKPDRTAALLPPPHRPFAATDDTVNPRDAQRFRAFRTGAAANGWFVENYAVNDSVRTGAHVDRNKDNALTVTTGWDGFASKLENHKIYSTVTLPAGRYELEVNYEATPAACGASRIVVAAGKGLPDIADTDAALATTPLADRRLTFTLGRETAVSVGIVFSLQGQRCVPVTDIRLRQAGKSGK